MEIDAVHEKGKGKGKHGKFGKYGYGKSGKSGKDGKGKGGQYPFANAPYQQKGKSKGKGKDFGKQNAEYKGKGKGSAQRVMGVCIAASVGIGERLLCIQEGSGPRFCQAC